MDKNELPRQAQSTIGSKKKHRYSGTKVRGAKRSLVRLKAAKIKGEQESKVLNEPGNSNGVYEDVMVFVKDQKITPGKPRGRPRKCALKKTTTPTNSKPRPSALEVIYLPPVRGSVENLYWQPPISLSQQNSYVLQGPKSSVTVLKSNPYRQTLLRSNIHTQSVLEQICPQSLFKQRTYPPSVLGPSSHSQSVLVSNHLPQSILGLNLRPQTLKTVLQVPVTVTKYVRTNQEKQKEESYYPEDLKEVLETIGEFPDDRGHHLEELIHWLKSPLSFKPSTLPLSVRRFHQHLEEWGETEDEKLQQLSRWLLESLQTAVFSVMSPKVVVESQPNASQCGVWASMDHA